MEFGFASILVRLLLSPLFVTMSTVDAIKHTSKEAGVCREENKVASLSFVLSTQTYSIKAAFGHTGGRTHLECAQFLFALALSPLLAVMVIGNRHSTPPTTPKMMPPWPSMGIGGF